MVLCSLLTPAIDVFLPIAKWTTVGVLSALVLVGVLLYFLKKDAFSPFLKRAVLGTAVYLLALAVVFFVLDIAYHYSDAYAEENWLDKQALVAYLLVPLLVFSGLSLLFMIAFSLVSKYKPEGKKLTAIIGGGLVLLALIGALVCIAVYYNKKIDGDGYYNSDTSTVKQLALYIGALLTALSIVGLSLFDKSKLAFDSRSLAYAGVCVAMSFALSYIKLWDMPNGGSVTLVSLLPVMIYAFAFGAKKGVFVGFAYGVLQATQDPWIIHPAQFLLDYPVAFSAVGLAGLFNGNTENKPWLKFLFGGLVAGAFRYLCHLLSGVFAFEAYAEGANPWVYSLIYNTYVFVDLAFVLIVGAFVFSSKAFLKQMQKGL